MHCKKIGNRSQTFAEGKKEIAEEGKILIVFP
jgi:hypothetical protein